MRSIVDNDYFTMLSRLVIGGVFLYASYYKVIEPAAFAKSIWFYHLVPGKLINLMAILMAWLELLVGLSLILGIWFRGAVLWANVLMLVFIAALGSTIARGISIDCGCFKASQVATGSAWRSLLFDAGAMIFCLQLLFSRSTRWQIKPSE